MFPSSETHVAGAGLSRCAKKGLAIKPSKGDALLFYFGGRGCAAAGGWAVGWKGGVGLLSFLRLGPRSASELPSSSTSLSSPSPLLGLLWRLAAKPDGSSDFTSSRISCPVTPGPKWVATSYVRSQPYR